MSRVFCAFSLNRGIGAVPVGAADGQSEECAMSMQNDIANLKNSLERISEGKAPYDEKAARRCIDNVDAAKTLLKELRRKETRAEFMEAYRTLTRRVATMESEIRNPEGLDPKIVEALKEARVRIIEAKEDAEKDFNKNGGFPFAKAGDKKDDDSDGKDSDSEKDDGKKDDDKDSDDDGDDDSDDKDGDKKDAKKDDDKDSDDDDGEKDDDGKDSDKKDSDKKDADKKDTGKKDTGDKDDDDGEAFDRDLIAEAIEKGDGYRFASLLKEFKSGGGNLSKRCDRHGSTLLHYAHMAGSPKMAAALVKEGANPYARDVYGRLPEFYAKKELSEAGRGSVREGATASSDRDANQTKLENEVRSWFEGLGDGIDVKAEHSRTAVPSGGGEGYRMKVVVSVSSESSFWNDRSPQGELDPQILVDEFESFMNDGDMRDQWYEIDNVSPPHRHGETTVLNVNIYAPRHDNRLFSESRGRPLRESVEKHVDRFIDYVWNRAGVHKDIQDVIEKALGQMDTEVVWDIHNSINDDPADAYSRNTHLRSNVAAQLTELLWESGPESADDHYNCVMQICADLPDSFFHAAAPFVAENASA